MEIKEFMYLSKRIIKAYFSKTTYLVCSLRPIVSNKVTVCTFEGKGGFCCSPKYIVEELHRRNSDLQFIWLVNDTSKEFPDYIRVVKNTWINRLNHLTNARVWIDNYRKPYGTRKRKNQLYLQTWHGNIGFKAMGLWRKEGFSKIAYLVSRNDSKMIDYVLSDSEWCNEMFPNGMVYDGEFLKFGIPKTDALYGDKRKLLYNKFRLEHDIDPDAKLIIYAPTFREAGQKTKRKVYVGDTSIDFGNIIKSFEYKFGGKWYLCLRLHPQLAAEIKRFPIKEYSERILDFSQEDDMNELLAGMDACITDYSSVAVDASLMEIPVFLYLDDLETYSEDRGNMQWIFPSGSDQKVRNNKEMTPGIDVVLPFDIARNNEELADKVRLFDNDLYKNKLKAFFKQVDMVFDGNASYRVADRVEKYMKCGEKQNDKSARGSFIKGF